MWCDHRSGGYRDCWLKNLYIIGVSYVDNSINTWGGFTHHDFISVGFNICDYFLFHVTIPPISDVGESHRRTHVDANSESGSLGWDV